MPRTAMQLLPLTLLCLSFTALGHLQPIDHLSCMHAMLLSTLQGAEAGLWDSGGQDEGSGRQQAGSSDCAACSRAAHHTASRHHTCGIQRVQAESTQTCLDCNRKSRVRLYGAAYTLLLTSMEGPHYIQLLRGGRTHLWQLTILQVTRCLLAAVSFSVEIYGQVLAFVALEASCL
jgi:hypothetical protein